MLKFFIAFLIVFGCSFLSAEEYVMCYKYYSIIDGKTFNASCQIGSKDMNLKVYIMELYIPEESQLSASNFVNKELKKVEMFVGKNCEIVGTNLRCLDILVHGESLKFKIKQAGLGR
jgi:hypothetical protein